MVIYSHREAVPVVIKKEVAEVVKPVEEPKVEEPVVEIKETVEEVKVEEPIIEVKETKVEEPVIKTEEPVNKKYNNKKKI